MPWPVHIHVSFPKKLGSLLLGLLAIGTGPLFAQDRAERTLPAPDRSQVERPAPPMERTQTERDFAPRSLDRPQGRISSERIDRLDSQRQAPRDMSAGRFVGREATRTPREIVEPMDRTQWLTKPTLDQWKFRDILAELKAMARRGFIAVNPISDDMAAFTDVPDLPAGWKAYGFCVPAGEKLHISLNHSSEGWFRLMMVNQWGNVDKGMLENLIPTGNPEATFTNFTHESKSVYLIVDDPGYRATAANPFSVKIERSWDPAIKKVDGVGIVTGIWAQKMVEAKSAPTFRAPSVGEPRS